MLKFIHAPSAPITVNESSRQVFEYLFAIFGTLVEEHIFLDAFADIPVCHAHLRVQEYPLFLTVTTVTVTHLGCLFLDLGWKGWDYFHVFFPIEACERPEEFVADGGSWWFLREDRASPNCRRKCYCQEHVIICLVAPTYGNRVMNDKNKTDYKFW